MWQTHGDRGPECKPISGSQRKKDLQVLGHAGETEQVHLFIRNQPHAGPGLALGRSGPGHGPDPSLSPCPSWLRPALPFPVPGAGPIPKDLLLCLECLSTSSLQ